MKTAYGRSPRGLQIGAARGRLADESSFKRDSPKGRMKTAVRAEPARPQERRRKRRLGLSSDFPHTFRWAVAENGQGRQEITCLTVDDHEVVREGLRLSLSRAPHI